MNSSEKMVFLSCRNLFCETRWGKEYLENKVLEYVIILFFLNLTMYFKGSTYLLLLRRGYIPYSCRFLLGFVQKIQMGEPGSHPYSLRGHFHFVLQQKLLNLLEV